MALFYDPITDEAGPSRTWEEDEEEFEELYGFKGQAAYEFKDEATTCKAAWENDSVPSYQVLSVAPCKTHHQIKAEYAVRFYISFELLPATEQHQKDSKLRTDLLLVGASPASCALLSHLGQSGEQVGTIYRKSEGTDEGRRHHNQEEDGSDGHLFRLSAAERTTVLISVPEGVRQEEAAAWARALFGGVSATRTLVLGSIPRSKFLGASDEGASPAIYTVETSAQRAASRQAGTKVTYLPTGNLVDGVAAAVLSHCQVRNLAATLLVNIDQTSGPDQKMVQAVANEIKECSELQSQHLDVHWPDLVAKSLKDLASKSRGQNWSELYS